ncbi:hypothetical protein [Thermobrachium celere]|uniref:hypothetical protein n=1 Tax=Thermobrachium celere TaxID=53422 RepID=UPI0019432487|nr:hypothetical protein [Thermobrachium celere]GFR35988.1 hypothetical protein TCEA9_18000 [Thermobrachium celere]
MKGFKKLIIALISLIIITDTAAIILNILLKNRILNPKYYLRVLETNGFYSYLENDIFNNLNNMLLKYNLGKDVYEKYIDKRMIEDNITRMVYCTVDYFLKVEDELPKPNLSLDVVIRREVEESLSRKGILNNEKISEEIGKRVNETVEEKLMIKNLDRIEKNRNILLVRDIVSNIYKNLRQYIIVLLTSISLLLLIAKAKGIRLISFILQIMGFITTFFMFFILLTRYYYKTFIVDQFYKQILLNIVIGIVLYFANIGIVIFILGILLYFSYKYINKKEA